MSKSLHETWIDDVLPKHSRLTSTVIAIIESILQQRNIAYLSVSGRTKDRTSILEKISRKGYKNPAESLTDLSGIRVIVYFESDVAEVSKIIAEAFRVDARNSSNKDDILSPNQIGYRSVHFVCDLGSARSKSPEHRGIETLKFEFQVRTVLQHAWAEISHDRQYKLSGKLPRELERKLYLYAGLLEIADKGFGEISAAVDSYVRETTEKARGGVLNEEVNSLSLKSFVSNWERTHGVMLEPTKDDLTVLVNELAQFGVHTLGELAKIEPGNYAEILKQGPAHNTIYGLVRDWMIISDWRRLVRDVEIRWVMDDEALLRHYLDKEEFNEFATHFEWVDPQYGFYTPNRD